MEESSTTTIGSGRLLAQQGDALLVRRGAGAQSIGSLVCSCRKPCHSRASRRRRSMPLRSPHFEHSAKLDRDSMTQPLELAYGGLTYLDRTWPLQTGQVRPEGIDLN